MGGLRSFSGAPTAPKVRTMTDPSDFVLAPVIRTHSSRRDDVSDRPSRWNCAHAQRCGWLKNGNRPSDFTTAKRCGARDSIWRPLYRPRYAKRSFQDARQP
jgi:hypothetical protein